MQKSLQKAKETPGRKGNAGSLTRPDFKLYGKAIVTQQHGTSTKANTKLNVIGDLEIKLQSYRCLIFD